MEKYLLEDGYLEVVDYDEYHEAIEIMVHRENKEDDYVSCPVVYNPDFDGDWMNYEGENPVIGFIYNKQKYLFNQD